MPLFLEAEGLVDLLGGHMEHGNILYNVYTGVSREYGNIVCI